MAPRTLGLLGISKVMTVTSTYDHRIIQGAESGLFLARMEELLKGEDGFYERIFEDLGLPHRPVRWEMDTAPGLGGPAGSREEVEKQARVLPLIHNYRVRGHLVADLDPLDSKRAPHQDLDPATYGLTLWDLDREFITNGLSGKDKATLREILEVLRDTYCGTIGVEYMYIADPERKDWLQNRMESARNYPALDVAEQEADPREARGGRELRALPAHEVRRPQALLAGGRRGAHPAARPHPERRRPRGREGGRDGHAPPRPPERPRQHRGQAPRPDLLGVRGADRPRLDPGLGRREVPPRRHRHPRGGHRARP